MIGTPEQDQFISVSQSAVVTTVRRDGSPASSLIGYARHGDRLLFSSEVGRLKGRTLSRDPRLVMTVINAAHPNSFISVEGTAIIHRDNPRELLEQMYAYWDNLAHLYPRGSWATRGRGSVDALFNSPGRAVFEVTPTRVSGVLQ